MREAIQFIPLATTILALWFAVALCKRWRARGGRHLLWFAVGALTYAAGTITESWTTLFGLKLNIYGLTTIPLFSMMWLYYRVELCLLPM